MTTTNKRLKVIVNRQTRSRRSRYKYWAFNTQDLANLFDVSIYTIRRWIKFKKIDPSNLLQIIELYNSRLAKRLLVPVKENNK